MNEAATAGTANRLVVLGWGNDARGDDGLGPLLLGRIAALDLPHVTVVEDFQLQIEHAMDLEAADLALFLDASVAAPAPFAFTETGPRDDASHSTHALSPEAVLAVFARVLGRDPPPAFVLAMRGEAFELGSGLGAAAAEGLDAAWAFVWPLIETPDVEVWRGKVTG
ncbi:hydrogenase maturation protease [Pinisolibacter sp.]|uniref:hydrogenase maturation protease n=1 Tax=Pinisolibacter sp. TaxID=2172024 RepID=UPI002FDDE6D4